jgi:site-specific recombinase XerD
MYTRVQEVLLDNGFKRYLLVDGDGAPVIPVAKYLKHLDNSAKSVNTLKTYCYALKLFFEYLEGINTAYQNVDINILSSFMGWLRSSFGNDNATRIRSVKEGHCEKSCNLYITAVTNFYAYLYRTEKMDRDVDF